MTKKIYDNSLEGIVRWMCDIAGLRFEDVEERNVEVKRDDRGIPYEVVLTHPSLDEAVTVQIGPQH